MAKWKFNRRCGTCTSCERAFDDGERLVSTLCLRADELSREDICPGCWTKRAEAGDEGAEDLFWWFTRFQENKKRTVQLDLGSLERLFFELEGRAEQPLRELRYVICLLLMRKRKLKVERIKRSDEGESFIVKRPRRDERYQVWVYDFSAERMAELREELQGIFDGADSEASEDETPAESVGDEQAQGAADTAVADDSASDEAAEAAASA